MPFGMESPKDKLRYSVKQDLKSLDKKEFHSQGAGAAVLLRSSRLWPLYKTLFIFLSINSEIDTRPLLATALKEGKKVFAPKVEEEDLCFYQVESPDGPWLKGPFGIREPDPLNVKAGEGDFPVLIICPGLAFDREGRRLGRGGGYYDRFLSGLESSGLEYFTLGFCMDLQIVSHVPVDDRDKKMDAVLTHKELMLYNLQGRNKNG